MAWNNDPWVVYHGTNQAFATQIEYDWSRSQQASVLLHANPKTDFGPGFYVTSRLREAQSWANMRARRSGGTAAVMAFDLDRDEIAHAGDHLAFTLPDDQFYDFVDYNRAGNLNHGRQGKPAATPPVPARNYDVIYGPVSKFPSRLPMRNWDQVCFFDDNSLRCLKNARIHSVAPFLVFTFP
jgi:hypothetical protein